MTHGQVPNRQDESPGRGRAGLGTGAWWVSVVPQHLAGLGSARAAAPGPSSSSHAPGLRRAVVGCVGIDPGVGAGWDRQVWNPI